MSPFWETVSGIILSVGGAGAIIAGIVKFAANQIAQQMTLQYKNELDKEIERLKADLVNRNHSYQAKFDKEFHLYGKLMASFLCMKKTVFWLFPVAFDHPPSDKDAKLEFYTKRYNEAYADMENARMALGENAIFIPEDIYAMFDEILGLCVVQYNLFPMCGPHVENKGHEIANIMSECYRRSSEIQEKFDVMTKKLRTYIAQQLE